MVNSACICKESNLTSTHWNFIRRSMKAPPPVLSPSSILPLPSTHCALIPSRKKSVRFSKMLFFSVLKIIRLKLSNLKLRKSGSVCVEIQVLVNRGKSVCVQIQVPVNRGVGVCVEEYTHNHAIS